MGARTTHLLPGVLAALAAATIFGLIANAVHSGAPITQLDVQLAQWFHAHATHGVTLAMLAITWIHSSWGILSMSAVGSGWLYRRRMPDWLLALIATVPGGMLLNVAFKHVFQRARPHWDAPLLTLETYSFPSGHTASATVLYGFVVCFIAAHARSRQHAVLAAIAAIAALAAVALVALSRMYLGVHYLSDVLAAVAEGCMWLAICMTALAAWRRWRIEEGEGA
ncbi:hypothetical protein GCM10027321_38070 [Massilia terrae]|uniref:Phosphatase PAP2 family protein n=1 Tax=Massilia terrae TaxID=1811224 RepID=A0ABT2D1Y8_9BURK|nr:phosphatase PAP2 family protein [Massilia terrae]MCS0660241.1 phosphatase PAP2 family protein [Massilia terrae]